ncbi:fumarylacetoacetate hydrolase family protein [Crocinitomicaceae bacterium]|nr:fumarylacetoacetate hydrolase family protein [Crocinitomicaceae bacterium]MDB4075169.1 fumarylacetoacetate hydrolase family protein [Crocinitomicaceae bacterium]MDC0099923.1 fumarylacetoacetate hydrolase family protein [Crocinitomicaceae bacterium]MDC1385451.1 fumarylacetoacetate hydrolase family protein [Crocinitomicaceae bacterium]|tara:strand:+ start:10729 stop:11340 length:612 start_codon:yes stop_codon:yes gene_type:complete
MKIICIGRNYADHAKEMNSPIPSVPMFFMKPDVAILRPGTPFYYPNFSKDIHFECELVVKINRVGKNISERFAHKYYSEIGLGIDFTARDLQKKCKEKGHPWEIAKSFEGSAPLSKEFIDKSTLDLADLKFSLTQNGTQVQLGSTKDMIFNIDQLIAYVSHFMTLKKGDLIYTGTPAGVGPIAIDDELKGFIGEKEMFMVRVK